MTQEYLSGSTPSDLVNAKPPEIERRVQAVLADTYTFVRSMEVNKGVSEITVEQLISDQIKRNGDIDAANKSQYNPYEYDPSKKQPSGLTPEEPANYLGGSDIRRPSKLARLLAMKNTLQKTIESLKKIEPMALADQKEMSDASEPV
jgi:hypothetical protein